MRKFGEIITARFAGEGLYDICNLISNDVKQRLAGLIKSGTGNLIIFTKDSVRLAGATDEEQMAIATGNMMGERTLLEQHIIKTEPDAFLLRVIPDGIEGIVEWYFIELVMAGAPLFFMGRVRDDGQIIAKGFDLRVTQDKMERGEITESELETEWLYTMEGRYCVIYLGMINSRSG